MSSANTHTIPASPDEALALADRLQALGQWREAIVALTTSNVRAPDTRVEQRLIELRLRAFESQQWPENPAPWPPAVVDVFPRETGIPEIDIAQLSAEMLAGAVLHHGSLLVRNLVPAEQIAQLREDIDRAVDARDARVAGVREAGINPWLNPPEYLAQYKLGVGRKFIAETGGVWAVDSPRSLFHVMELYRQLGMQQLMAEYFGDTPCVSVRKWVLRRVQPLPAEPDWHQDGAFMGTAVRSMNLWIALSDCGGDLDTPGIDIVPKRLEHIVQTGTDGARFDWTVGPAYVEQHFRDTPPVRPLFKAGDALFFDHLNLHRTAYSPTMRHNRYAIECWFFAASLHSANQIPMLL